MTTAELDAIEASFPAEGCNDARNRELVDRLLAEVRRLHGLVADAAAEVRRLQARVEELEREREPHRRHCEQCGIVFTQNANQRFCTPRCRSYAESDARHAKRGAKGEEESPLPRETLL